MIMDSLDKERQMKPSLTSLPKQRICLKVFSAICCCCCCGIPALVYLIRSMNAYYEGDIEKGRHYSRRSHRCMIAAIVIGTLWLITYLALAGVYTYAVYRVITMSDDERNQFLGIPKDNYASYFAPKPDP